MAEPTERIPQHKHCIYCGKAFIDGNGRYCSDKCKDTKKEELTKSKNKLLLIWLAAVGVMVIAIIIGRL